jgi:hypothetical protein
VSIDPHAVIINRDLFINMFVGDLVSRMSEDPGPAVGVVDVVDE